MFEAFGCTVDWPSARYWREIAARYPEAKVVLSVRPEQSWLKSMQATIAPLLRSYRTLPPGIFRDTMEMAQAIIAAQTFGGRLDDPEHMLAVYRAHNEEVRRTIAPDRCSSSTSPRAGRPCARSSRCRYPTRHSRGPTRPRSSRSESPPPAAHDHSWTAARHARCRSPLLLLNSGSRLAIGGIGDLIT